MDMTAAIAMDRMYRRKRHFYDVPPSYYLLGRGVQSIQCGQGGGCACRTAEDAQEIAASGVSSCGTLRSRRGGIFFGHTSLPW